VGVGGSSDGGGGDGGGDERKRAFIERVVKAVLEEQVRPPAPAGASRPHQYTFWSSWSSLDGDGFDADAFSSAGERSYAGWRRALASYKLAHDVAKVTNALERMAADPAAAPRATAPPQQVRMKCGICDAFLGMTEFRIDQDGVGSVAARTVCANCLEDALRMAAGDDTGSATGSKPPVISGGGQGDGQPRARLQMVRAVALKKGAS
jgi:hypothetical protein